MRYSKTVQLKNRIQCVLSNAVMQDAAELTSVRIQTSGETDYMARYPDEISVNLPRTEEYIRCIEESPKEVQICARVNGKIVGLAGVNPVGQAEKWSHRAQFGVCVLRDYWNLGIGAQLTSSAIDFAREAGYSQLELDVVTENLRALALYEKLGFREYGRNPRGFRLRTGQWQELVEMRLELT